MLNFDVSDWKYFSIKELFTWEKGKYLSSSDKKDYKGAIPCINGSSLDNGLLTFLDKSIEEKRFKLQKAPCLSLSRVGNAGLTFVQPQDFYIADNAYSLRLKNIIGNRFIYLFLSTVLNLEVTKYSYGRIINSKYFETRIKLPSDSKGQPDWQFMEDYIEKIYNKFEKRTIIKIKTKPNSLDISDWKQFKISDLFKCSTTPTVIETQPGTVPYVTRTSTNNGVDSFVSEISKKLNKGNCITIGAEGRVAFYQSDQFISGVKIYTLRNTNLNKYNALFISTILNKEIYRYCYGRARILDKIKEEFIKLPTDSQGNPDWQFMENYIKSLPYSDLI